MISVIIPTFNRADLIKRSVDSVINQTYSNWELIIVDDRSTDDTRNVIAPYLKSEHNIKYFENRRAKGPAGARNCGIEASSGEYLAFLDSDDEWTPNHLKECLEALKKTNYKVCSALWKESVFGDIKKLEDNPWYDNIFNEMKTYLNVDRKDKLWIFDHNLFEHIIEKDFYCFHINTLVLSKEIINQVGMFDESFLACEDLDFIYRVLEKYNLVTVNSYHFIYYYGQNNLYAFINRNQIDFKKDSLSEEEINRLTLNISYKIRHFKSLISIIKYSERIKKKKAAIAIFNDRLFNKYLTIYIMNFRTSSTKTNLMNFIKTLCYARKFNMLKQLILATLQKYDNEFLHFH